MSDNCLMPNEQTAMSWREQDIMSWDDNVGFVLDQHTGLDSYKL
jgi:hypothetical protein